MAKEIEGSAKVTVTPHMVTFIRSREGITHLMESDPVALDTRGLPTAMVEIKKEEEERKERGYSLTSQGFRLFDVFQAAVAVPGNTLTFAKEDNSLTYLFAEKIVKYEELGDHMSKDCLDSLKEYEMISPQGIYYLIDQKNMDPDDDEQADQYFGTVLELNEDEKLNTIIINRKGEQLWPQLGTQPG